MPVVFKTVCGALFSEAVSYSSAGAKPCQLVVLSATQRIRVAISERGAAIC
jgi:hypothetical protein